MKNIELLFRIGFESIRKSALPEIDNTELPWELISKRIDSISTEYSCLSTACILRDYYEQDLNTDPRLLQFKAVVNEKNKPWHIWLEKDGRIVDTDLFISKYKKIYIFGKKIQEFEEIYKSIKSTPVFDG